MRPVLKINLCNNRGLKRLYTSETSEDVLNLTLNNFVEHIGYIGSIVWMLEIDLAKVTPTEWTEMLPELTPETVNLKFIRTKHDLYWTELDPNVFYSNRFSFQEKLIGTKISWPEVDPNWQWSDPKPNLNWIILIWKWPDLKLIRSKPKQNDPFARFG